MKVSRLHHIAIAVKSLGEALPVYERLFGLRAEKIEEVPQQAVRVACLPLGDLELELLEPTDPKGGVARFLESRGEGVHHICLEVEDIDGALEALAAQGVELIDRRARKGVSGRIAFLHPRAAHGVLIELAERLGPGHD